MNIILPIYASLVSIGLTLSRRRAINEHHYNKFSCYTYTFGLYKIIYIWHIISQFTSGIDNLSNKMVGTRDCAHSANDLQ
jgi:hypothetical protein